MRSEFFRVTAKIPIGFKAQRVVTREVDTLSSELIDFHDQVRRPVYFVEFECNVLLFTITDVTKMTRDVVETYKKRIQQVELAKQQGLYSEAMDGIVFAAREAVNQYRELEAAVICQASGAIAPFYPSH